MNKIPIEIITFFKKYNLFSSAAFEYIQNHLTIIPSMNNQTSAFFGCFYNINQNNILTSIDVIVPKIADEKSLLINIHELTHAIIMYKKIGQEFMKDITTEAIPMMFEKLYIIDNFSKELVKLGEQNDNIILERGKESYKFGLEIRDELISTYDNNIQNTESKIKKLSLSRKN